MIGKVVHIGDRMVLAQGRTSTFPLKASLSPHTVKDVNSLPSDFSFTTTNSLLPLRDHPT